MSRNDIMAFIGANARGFHDAMSRVRSDTKATASSSQREFSQLSAGLNRSMSLVKGALAGIGIGLSIQGVKEIVSEIASIETSAKRAGLSIKSFQQMKYVAETNRIDVDAMADAFRELNLRANEYAQTGKGSGAEAFAQLGMSPEEVKKRLKYPADLMLEIIDRTRQLKDTAAGMNVFDKILGGQGGEQFVSLIEQGRDKLSDTIKEGEELGRVLSEDVVKAAADVDKKFQDIANTVSHSLKGAIVDAYQAFQVFLSLYNEMEDRSSEALRANQQQLQTRRKQLEEQKGGLEDKYLLSPFGKGATTEMVEVDKQLKAINAELERRNKLVSLKNPSIPPPVTPYILPSDKKSKGSRAAKITDAEREKKAIDDLIKSLEQELALVGLSDAARDKEIALRRAGAGASGDQREQIITLIEARYSEQKAVEAVEAQLRRNADAALDLADISMQMIDTIIDGSFNAKDALAGLLRQMAQALLMGQGPLANLFGMTPQSSGLGGLFSMAFGGPRAAGGSVTPGNFYRVNEKGEEFFSPGSHGKIIPHDGGGGGSGGFSFAPVYQIDARGADQAAVARLEAGLKRTNNEMEARVIQTVRKLGPKNIK